MKVKFIFAWYDFWVGAFWDREGRKLYVFPLPMVGVVFESRTGRKYKRTDYFCGFCRKSKFDRKSLMAPCWPEEEYEDRFCICGEEPGGLMKRIHCKDCKFADIAEHEDKTKSIECRRHSPRFFRDDIASWPEVQEDDWCGEGE